MTALITISGYPSSGKSQRAAQIKRHIEARLEDPSYVGPSLSVAVLDDTLNIDRSSYNDSRSEKPARGTLFTAVQRNLAQNKVVIVDSLDYIKGFRYQIYCAARELKVRVCTAWVYVLAMPDLCKQWNSERTDGEVYAPETLANLLQRYEEPSSMVRWDSSLSTVSWTDEDVPADDIWRAITEGIMKPPNTGTQAVAKAPTDALRTLEHTTASVVSALVSEQVNSGSLGGITPVTLSSTLQVRITLPPRNVTLSELQRLKRQFVTLHKKAITLGTTEKGAVDWSEQSVADKFVVYLEENMKP
ncbi:chromatin associated protein KTI12 [Pisolithus orientalis]|uniref:chromatin associated protein KTI12 n=1 Tax=Pisolithus orientalis TaxID=936130 RepID=UPI0022246992|nr:chromatin associated protein KTI12 [Pisolithus orientalis]KAI5991314.1 chromatin associated protein KTI12 [Pisolithus orientalis]